MLRIPVDQGICVVEIAVSRCVAAGLRLQDGRPCPCGLRKSPLPRSLAAVDTTSDATHRDRLFSVLLMDDCFHEDGMRNTPFHLASAMDATLQDAQGPRRLSVAHILSQSYGGLGGSIATGFTLPLPKNSRNGTLSVQSCDGDEEQSVSQDIGEYLGRDPERRVASTHCLDFDRKSMLLPHTG